MANRLDILQGTNRSRRKRTLSGCGCKKNLSGIFTTIRPTSIYPETYTGFPADMDDWGCGQWQVYHERNKQLGGDAYARQLIQTEAGRIGWFADVHLCKYNCDWVNYFNKEGLPGGNIFSKLYCAGSDAVDAAGEVTGSIKNIGVGIRSITGSGILYVGLIGGGIYLANKYLFNGKKR